MRLCCVLDDGNACGLGEAGDCVHVRWLAIKVNRDHCRRPRRHNLSDFVSAHQQSSRINVCEYDLGADRSHRFCGANESEGWDDDLVAGANSQPPQGEL